MDEEIATAAKWIATLEKIVVFTGAGISTESGLSDFRGPNGVWTRQDKGLPPLQSKTPWHLAEPNAAHFSIVELQEMGKLDFVISQNSDNFHLRSGIQPDKIAELHGNVTLLRCLACEEQVTYSQVDWDKKIWGIGFRASPAQDHQPQCPNCGGRLIASTVNFGEPLPEKELQLAKEHSMTCDVFFVIGSSLVVTPASELPELALKNGAKLILLNLGETPFDDRAHLRVWRKAGEFVPAVVKRVKELIS